jgi:hypothetical protein
MSPQNHCYCLERAGISHSSVALLAMEEVLREEGLGSTVVLAIVDTFRSLLDQALEAESEVRSLKNEVDTLQARIEESAAAAK